MADFSLHHITQKPRQTAGDAPPALILLHGVRSNEQDLMGLAPLFDRRLFIISARAPMTFAPGAFGWYPVEFTPNGFVIDEAEAIRSRDLLLKFIFEAGDAYGLDRRRIFLGGFSQGAVMSIGAALHSPRSVAGVVAMSGRLIPSTIADAAPAEELKGFPIIAVHGTGDTVIPVQDGRDMRDQLSRLPVELTYREYDMAHHVTPESMRYVADWLKARLDGAIG